MSSPRLLLTASRLSASLATALLVVAAAGGCAAVSQDEVKQERDIIEMYGSRTFDADAPTTRGAIVRALETMGYDVVVNDPTVVATAPHVEARENVTAAVGGGGGGSNAGAGVAVADSHEVLTTRAWEARIEALEGARTKVTLSPTIRIGEQDITVRTVIRGRTVESKRIDEIMNAAERFLHS